MGNVYGTGLSTSQLQTLLDSFYAEPLPIQVPQLHSSHDKQIPLQRLSHEQTTALRQVLLNITNFKKHLPSLFTNMRLRDMFTGNGKKEHTKALFRYCIDLMQEVASFEYSPKNKMDFQLCTGATYIVSKMIGYIMKDPRAEEEYLWSEMSQD